MKSGAMLLFMALGAAATRPSVQDQHQGTSIPWEGDFQKGLEQARKQGKLLLVHFGAEW